MIGVRATPSRVVHEGAVPLPGKGGKSDTGGVRGVKMCEECVNRGLVLEGADAS